jgi:hypothetical protein
MDGWNAAKADIYKNTRLGDVQAAFEAQKS